MSRALPGIHSLGECSCHGNHPNHFTTEYHISREIINFIIFCVPLSTVSNQAAEADEDHEPEPDWQAGGDERDAERRHPRRSFW